MVGAEREGGVALPLSAGGGDDGACLEQPGDLHSAGPQAARGHLRGWAGYFRYGNSTVQFDTITRHADTRLALLIAKRHQQHRRYGWQALASQPDRCGLISLNGTIIAPRPNRPWRGAAECRR